MYKLRHHCALSCCAAEQTLQFGPRKNLIFAISSMYYKCTYILNFPYWNLTNIQMNCLVIAFDNRKAQKLRNQSFDMDHFLFFWHHGTAVSWYCSILFLYINRAYLFASKTATRCVPTVFSKLIEP